MSAPRLVRWLALATGACAATPAPAPAIANRPADPVGAATSEILAANRRLDERARAEFRTRSAGELPYRPWLGTCDRAADVAWCAALDEVRYGTVYDVTFTVVHVDRSGIAVRAPEPVRFNLVAFNLTASRDGTAADVLLTSEGPERDYDAAIRYVWDGARVRVEPASE